MRLLTQCFAAAEAAELLVSVYASCMVGFVRGCYIVVMGRSHCLAAAQMTYLARVQFHILVFQLCEHLSAARLKFTRNRSQIEATGSVYLDLFQRWQRGHACAPLTRKHERILDHDGPRGEK